MKKTSLTPCHSCGKEISEHANMCPHCGAERYSKSVFRNRVLLLGAGAPVVLGVFSSICFLVSSPKGEVHPIYFMPLMIVLLWLLFIRSNFNKTKEIQGIGAKDVIGKFTAFIVFLPTWIVFCGVFLALVVIMGGEGVAFKFMAETPFYSFLFFILGYIPFLKFMKYI
jgi:hypothetical protein